MFRRNPGATSVTIFVRFRDTNGVPKTGLTASSSGLGFAYTRVLGSNVTFAAVALNALTDAWSAGGFLEVNATTSAGVYRLDLPNAACASGSSDVIVSFKQDSCLSDSVLVRLDSASTNVGAGAVSYTVTVNNSSTGLPLAGATVWATSDLAGNNVIAGTLTTNTSGQVTFFLDTGTNYIWVRDPGFSGTNPTAVTV